MEFILASASPRRRELLKEVVSTFEIRPAQGEEKATKKNPKSLVKELARQKAEEVFSLPSSKGKIVLGADTVVAFQGKALGKPKDEAEAISMLKGLSGGVHFVYTGVCFLYEKEGKKKALCRAAKTRVYFNDLSKEWIENYVAGGSPMDKAGAYGIQDGGLVKKIRGSFSNVVGLPVELCKKLYARINRE